MPQLERGAGSVELAEVASSAQLPLELAGGMFKRAPAFFDPVRLPQIMLKEGGALPTASVNAIGQALAKIDTVVVGVAKDTCTSRSLAKWAWELFVAWEGAGGPAKEKWAMLALGRFGDDDAAQKLTAKIRKWPGESQHKRATWGLEVLHGIGSDVALMCLNGIAQKVRYKALQRNARSKMDEIAKRRGFTTEELEDRLVPDLDLEDDGSMELDFGPRGFRVGFDEALKPYVVDAKGKRRANLPKPGVKDDAAIAGESVERFKAMKKSVRALAKIQVARLESAMGRRRWSAEDFEAFLVHHPLMFHLVKRVVWGVLPDGGDVQTSTLFRVAEDRTYADVADEPMTLPADSTICLAHRIHISDDDRKTWRALFADYELVAPFDQLDRDVFRLEPGDATHTEIIKFKDRQVETAKLRGLQSRGWRHGSPQDAGVYHCFGKPIRGSMHAWLPIENGMAVGYSDYDDATQTLGEIIFGQDEPWFGPGTGKGIAIDEVDEITISEVLRDVDSLGQAESA